MSALVVTSEVSELFFAPSQVLSPKLVSGNTYKHVAGVLKGSISCIFLQSCTLIIYSLIYVLRHLEKWEKMSLVVTILNFFYFSFSWAYVCFLKACFHYGSKLHFLPLEKKYNKHAQNRSEFCVSLIKAEYYILLWLYKKRRKIYLKK